MNLNKYKKSVEKPEKNNNNLAINTRLNVYLVLMLIMTMANAKLEAKAFKNENNKNSTELNSKENNYNQEFERHREAILNYKPMSDGDIADIENIHYQFFSDLKSSDLPDIKIDFSNIPKSKILKAEDIIEALEDTLGFESIEIIRPKKEKDTGIICVYFLQSHSSWSVGRDGEVVTGVGLGSIENQSSILLGSEQLLNLGVRSFGMENREGDYNYSEKEEAMMPADIYKNFNLLGDTEILKQLKTGIDDGYAAFELLHSAYPFLDLYGCDYGRSGIRKNIVPVEYQMQNIQNNLAGVYHPATLLDKDKFAAYKNWLLEMPQGEKILRDIEYSLYLGLWYFSSTTDDHGTDGTGLAVYAQLKRLQTILSDQNFLNLQGDEFASNVFALQFGSLHSISEKNGIAAKCQELGITCVQITPPASDIEIAKGMLEASNNYVKYYQELLKAFEE
jgi:hypothetical protein